MSSAAAASSGTQTAPGATDTFSASTALLLSALGNTPTPGAKRSAGDAGLPETTEESAVPRPEAPGRATEVRDAMEETAVDATNNTYTIAFIRVDEKHVSGNLHLEKYILASGSLHRLGRPGPACRRETAWRPWTGTASGS